MMGCKHMVRFTQTNNNIYTKYTICELLIAKLDKWHEERGLYIYMIQCLYAF